jgi:N-acetylglutamate synthase-like GNAT family acetyltransferase
MSDLGHFGRFRLPDWFGRTDHSGSLPGLAMLFSGSGGALMPFLRAINRNRNFIHPGSELSWERIAHEENMVVVPRPVAFRRYRATDYSSVASLWTRINRQLAPVGMEELFEQYIATTIDGELKRLPEIFSKAKRNAFWVVESANEIIGCFGIESHGVTDTELRRMYLDAGYRGLGIAQRMLDHAQAEARAFGFTKMIVSSAQIQEAAVSFYRKSGFQQVRIEVAEKMTPKQAGGGLTRFHFEKVL